MLWKSAERMADHAGLGAGDHRGSLGVGLAALSFPCRFVSIPGAPRILAHATSDRVRCPRGRNRLMGRGLRGWMEARDVMGGRGTVGPSDLGLVLSFLSRFVSFPRAPRILARTISVRMG
jgi:hypothetical protein